METRANHIWVGIVTLLLLGALAAFFVWLAQINSGSEKQYDIFFKQSVEGLAKGSTVTFSGVPAGQVAEIVLWQKNPEFVRVRIKIDEQIPILQGTTATVLGSFTGVSTIQLAGAVKNAPPIADAGPEGVPVIPTRPGGLGELLNNAPLLLERLATLTERMSQVLSDNNLKSIEGILANSDTVSGNLARSTPQLEAAMGDLRGTLRQASQSLAAFERIAGSTQALVDEEGRSIATDLRETLAAARQATAALETTVGRANAPMAQIDQRTLPEAEAALRELRATTRSLRELTDKLNQQGASALIGSPPLPDYKP